MKFIPAEDGQVLHRLELTRRNLEVLLAKLDDPLSHATLLDPDWRVTVKAVEKHKEGTDSGGAIGTDEGFVVPAAGHCVHVVPVENDVHYANRAPGAMYMPSTGETI